MPKEEYISVRQLLAEVNVLDVENFVVKVEREGKDLVLSPEALAALSKVDTNGRLHGLVNTSGQITEANSAAIDAVLDVIRLRIEPQVGPLFGTLPDNTSKSPYAAKKLFQTTLTATAGGEIVAANVGPPTLANYQGCMLLTHIYSDQTDASIALSITASSGGFTTGLGSLTIATVADTVSPDFNQGLAWLCDTDAATIQVSCAAGQAGNAQSVTFCGVYWYET